MQVCHAMLQPAAQADTQTGTTSRNLSSLEDTDAATASQADPNPGRTLSCAILLPTVLCEGLLLPVCDLGSGMP